MTHSTNSPSVLGLGVRSLRKRGVAESIRRVGQFTAARWYLRKATAVGSVLLDGRAHVINQGRLVFGDHVRLNGSTVRLEFACFRGARLTVGDGTFINYGTNVSAVEGVSIGNHCAIGQYSIVMDCDYHAVDDLDSRGNAKAITIEDDVWLGARTIVLKGSRIGRGAVVAANSVVRGEIPPFALAAGSPARVVRYIGARADA
jgi:acetyltransferase-like isoleucine patch superfamily enzyme